MPAPLALLALVALVACGSSPERKRTARLDEQRPLRLVYCVESGGMSSSDAADVIRERLARRDDVIVKSEDDRLVFEVPADRDGGPIDRQRAAAELTDVLRSGDLPRPVPCDEPGGDWCERYLRHTSSLTGFKGVHGPGDRQFCESQTAEQQECGLAARTQLALFLCIQFADPARRATARGLTPSVRSSWPGSHPLGAVLGGAAGCGFAGLVGVPGAPVDEGHVLAAFAVRQPGQAGDPDNVLAWLVRGGPTQPWTCSKTDPPGRCASLHGTCQPR